MLERFRWFSSLKIVFESQILAHFEDLALCLYSQNTIIYLGYVEFWPKNLTNFNTPNEDQNYIYWNQKLKWHLSAQVDLSFKLSRNLRVNVDFFLLQYKSKMSTITLELELKSIKHLGR